MKLILASANKHKAIELTTLLQKTGISVVPAADKIEVVEDGATFIENALKKAEAYFTHFKKPTIADDSGLIVDALPGELGVQTARFGGDGLSDRERCELLLERLEDKKDISQRSAYFVCQLCLYLSSDEIFFFEGRVQGHIADKISGSDGFGYDPIFIPKDGDGLSTFAELAAWKEQYSHRATACFEISKFFKERNCQIK